MTINSSQFNSDLTSNRFSKIKVNIYNQQQETLILVTNSILFNFSFFYLSGEKYKKNY